MATTHVEFEPVSGGFGPSYKTDVLVRNLKARYNEDQANEDKCGSVDDACYYQGRMDAVADLLYEYGWRVKRE